MFVFSCGKIEMQSETTFSSLPPEIAACITQMAPDPKTFKNMLLSNSAFSRCLLLEHRVKAKRRLLRKVVYIKDSREVNYLRYIILPSGVRHGKYKVIHGGKMIKKGKYRQGKREGLWRDFDPENGKITSEINFKNDIPVYQRSCFFRYIGF